MNLNKTEKLLAAKRKLKEFQLQKRLHAQETSSKQPNTNTVDDSILQCQRSCQDTEMDKSCNQNNQNDTKYTENLPQSEKHLNNIMHKEENILNYTFNDNSNSTNEAEMKANSDQILEQNRELDQNILVSDNSTESAMSHSNNDKNSTPLYLQSNSQFIENDEKYNLNITPPNRPSTVQKEHLLEMASEVANVLTDDIDDNEPASFDVELRYRNQFLNTCLEEQKQLVNDLHIQVSRYHSRVAELEGILTIKDSEFEAKLVREVNPLKEQLQVHTQTTGILIAEKAELTAALVQSQKVAKQNSEELEEINGKLKHSQFRINELEKELHQIKNNSTDTQKNAQQIQQIHNELEKKYHELRKEKEDSELEISELKQKLNLKNTEFINLQQEFQEKAALLSLNELRIQQLTDTSQTLESQHQTVTVLEQQLAQMRETLKLVNDEKEEASRQYQNYVRQLDVQQTKLLNELESQKRIINDLNDREKSYVQRLSDVEQQWQHEKEINEALLPLHARNNDINTLLKTIEELTSKQEKLRVTVSEKDAEIEILTKEIEVLRDTKEDGADATKLVQALESEKLGASRAILQNQQLKQQLVEMENAFVTLSNAKLDLTEKLQAERNIGRRLNAKLNTIESEMDNLKDNLKEKEMFVMELEKDKLQNAQIVDQMQHYQAQSHHTNTLQQELQNALICIQNLKKENEILFNKLENKVPPKVSLSNEVANINSNDAVRNDPNDDITQSFSPLPETNSISDDLEPITKLEKRFKEAMEKVAELTDEKQKLEHLVLQLQSETETIGEYITLYQKQRAVLGNRWKEREQTFSQIVEQRNQQQEQLHKLKVLVTEWLKKQPETPSSTNTCTEYHKEVNIDDTSQSTTETQKNSESPLVEDKTTSEILDLLTEIKDCKDACITEPNFHPCPWCSGRLITI